MSVSEFQIMIQFYSFCVRYFIPILVGSEKEYVQIRALRYTRSLAQPQEYVGSIMVESSPIEVSIGEQLKCKTSGCIEAAKQIKSYLDESVDPCDNFYEFACGKYINTTEIPAGKGMIDTFTVISDLVQEQLHTLLSEPLQANESKALRLARDFHLACLNETIIEKRGLKPLTDILDDLGDWPVVEGDEWLEDEFDWVEMIEKFRNIGFDTDVIFSLTLETDLRNSSRRILYVSCTSIISLKYFIIDRGI